MDLNEMLVFARVVQAGSITAAAAELEMPKSTVSRKLTELEARLKARLLQRTTRKLSLTDVGRTYYDYCARIVSEVEEAERAVSSLQEVPRGLLRVTAGTSSGWLSPIIADFLERYPEVRLELSCTGRVVDLIEEHFDVGIRAGALADSTLVARSLGGIQRFLVATPTYLKRRGRPKAPDDLKAHDCLLFGTSAASARVRLMNGEQSMQVTLSTRMILNDLDVLRAGAAAGLGIAILPVFDCADDLRSGRLERVLRDWSVSATPIHAVYPSARHISPKVKVFVEHLQRRMAPPPWELVSMP